MTVNPAEPICEDVSCCQRMPGETGYVDIFDLIKPDKKYIEKAITQLALSMPQYNVNAYFLAKPETLKETDLCLFRYDKETKRCCGFLSANIMNIAGKTGIMLYTLLISEHSQGTRVTFSVLHSLFSWLYNKIALDYEYIFLKTVNPRSFRIISSFSDIKKAVFFPQILSCNDNALTEFSAQLAQTLHPDCKYNKKKGIIYNAGGTALRDFYQEIPQCRDSVINHFFFTHMTLSDRVICVLRLPDENARVQLYRRLNVTVSPGDV